MEEYYIELTRDQRTRVDKEDYESLNQFNWQSEPRRMKNGFYARRNDGYAEDGRRLKVSMHRQIMNPPHHLEVDHINGDTLDNRKCNLRLCTHIDNLKNQKSRGGKSKYRGITLHVDNKWRARIMINNKRVHLGLFKTEDEAFEAYNKAAKEYYGEFYG